MVRVGRAGHRAPAPRGIRTLDRHFFQQNEPFPVSGPRRRGIWGRQRSLYWLNFSSARPHLRLPSRKLPASTRWQGRVRRFHVLFADLGADLGMSCSILDVGLELVESFLAPLSSCPRLGFDLASLQLRAFSFPDSQMGLDSFPQWCGNRRGRSWAVGC